MNLAIHTEGLSKRYGSALALDGLDLSVAEGEVYGYLGPNGSGKTTTIRCCSGLHRPSARARRAVRDRRWGDPVRAHRRVAYVAGEPFLWPSMTGAETLEFLARLHGGTDVAYREQLVERFQLERDKKIRALSKGNRQKVQLVAALATRADLLLLDEPTSGLDPLMEVAFRDCVKEAKERGQTVFLSSHILSEVEALCDRVGILRDGQARRRGDARAAAPPRRADGRGRRSRAARQSYPRCRGSRSRARAPTRCASRSRASIGPLIAALAGSGSG